MNAELELRRSHPNGGLDTRLWGSPNTTSDDDTELETRTQATSVVTVDLSDYAQVEAGHPCSKAALGVEPDFPVSTVNNLSKLVDSTSGNTNYLTDNMFKPDAQSAIDFILE